MRKRTGPPNKTAETDDLHEKYKPHKKEKVLTQRLNAKQWMLMETYIGLLIGHYLVGTPLKKKNILASRLQDFEKVI